MQPDPIDERDEIIETLRTERRHWVAGLARLSRDLISERFVTQHLRAELAYRREDQARTALRARRAGRITRWVMAGILLSYSLAGFVDQPCARESSHWCTWYADRQGNGQGQSFLDIGGWRTSSWFLITRPHR